VLPFQYVCWSHTVTLQVSSRYHISDLSIISNKANEYIGHKSFQYCEYNRYSRKCSFYFQLTEGAVLFIISLFSVNDFAWSGRSLVSESPDAISAARHRVPFLSDYSHYLLARRPDSLQDLESLSSPVANLNCLAYPQLAHSTIISESRIVRNVIKEIRKCSTLVTAGNIVLLVVFELFIARG
jgi:hypothetical protein